MNKMCECCGLSAMKKWNLMKVAWLRCLTVFCVKYEVSKMPQRTIILLVAGLDGAGKSTIVNYLFNKSLLPKSTTVPTMGFRTVTFKYKKRLTIQLYDVGGSAQIRELWKKYYEEVHGVIYVVDSSDGKRLFETARVFQELACHDYVTEKPILLLGNKQDQKITLSELNLIEFMNIYRVSSFSRCFTRIEICTCFKDKYKKFNLNQSIDNGFEWLINMIDYNYEAYEREMKQKKQKRKVLRQTSTRSWTTVQYRNSFDYSDTDSETYGKPIIPNDELLDKQRKARNKRKSLKNIFKKSRNKTAPLTDEPTVPTKKEMKELMRSITLEDLIKNTQVQEDAIMEYRRPRRWRKKRPTTAPSKMQLSELIRDSHDSNIEETVVQINQQGNKKEITVQINNANNTEQVTVEANQVGIKNQISTETIEEIV